MAKKRANDSDFEGFDKIEEFNASAAVEKMPIDVTGGKTPLTDYMNVPVGMIDPFSLKDGSDFSRAQGRFFDRMVETVRDVGVLEAITVRPRQNGRYEVLAGETRWNAAKEAGKKTIPAHIIDVDDSTARKIYALTNLMRRDLSIRDRINGWWHVYESASASGTLANLRNDVTDEDLIGQVPEGDRISYRQIMRYVQMHNLLSEWIELMEPENSLAGKPVVSQRVAVQISNLTHSQQGDILSYANKLSEDSAKMLVDLSNGKLKNDEDVPYEWATENITRIVAHQNLNDSTTAQTSSGNTQNRVPVVLNKMKTKIMNVATESLRPEDYGKAPEIIRPVLILYYDKNK